MASPFPPRQLKLLAIVAAGLAAVAAVVVLAHYGFDLFGVVHRLLGLAGRAVALLGTGGPWVFFTAMALAPAAGVPMITFSLTAGHLFEDRMGVGAVVAAGLAAATVNLLLTYWLARWALRPGLTRLLGRLGYSLPNLDAADQTDLIVILRVTPGVPFFAQNYLLGLANAPVGRYVAISCAAVWSYTSAFILFGDALAHGKGGLAFSAGSLLVAALAATHLLRRHYAGRKASV
jgi:uncharacterized membrane protein YdjX (TVP38/TMEM64 family)